MFKIEDTCRKLGDKDVFKDFGKGTKIKFDNFLSSSETVPRFKTAVTFAAGVTIRLFLQL